jgi:hypothetical protein
MEELKRELTREEITAYLNSCPEDDKGNKIVPDEFFDLHCKQLPNGTKNQSGTYRAQFGGRLVILGSDPERDKEIQDKGREANKSMFLQRRTFKEEADILLSKIDKENGKTGLENLTIAMYKKAKDGDVKAYTALRDTVGEQPVSKQEINADIMTDGDRVMIQNALNRLKANSPNGSMRADSP